MFSLSAGARQFCRIRSSILTMRKRGLTVLDVLESIFTESPALPKLQPKESFVNKLPILDWSKLRI